MRHPARFLLILLVLGLLVAACGGSDGTSDAISARDAYGSTAGPAEEPADEAAGEGASSEPQFTVTLEGAPAGADTDSQGVVAVLQPGDLGRSIVYTATLEIQVDDVIAAGRQALVELQGLGGILFGQETTSGPEPRSVLTIKVRPENFAAALDRLAGLGTLLGQNVFADDVTERVVDLESRITTAEASVERLRTFLERATDLESVAALEAQLLQRETDLELLRGELRTLEDQVALATIVLVLTQALPGPAYELVQTGYLGHDEGAGCPQAEELALDEGDAFTLCYEVVNTGDTFLSEIEVRDPGFEFDMDDLIAVEGDPAALLPPGGRLLFAFEAVADPAVRPSPSLRATAVDANGAPLHQQVEAAKVEVLALEVAPDDSLPGFGDALSGAWHALQRLGGILVLIGGAVVPFLWIPALALIIWWWQRRRRRQRRAAAQAAPAPAIPAPPAPPAQAPED
jgi:hypothetical protein